MGTGRVGGSALLGFTMNQLMVRETRHSHNLKAGTQTRCQWHKAGLYEEEEGKRDRKDRHRARQPEKQVGILQAWPKKRRGKQACLLSMCLRHDDEARPVWLHKNCP